jgi:hypothetical protein
MRERSVNHDKLSSYYSNWGFKAWNGTGMELRDTQLARYILKVYVPV